MGVSKETIDKYSVYSLEAAKEMSKQISLFSNSDYEIGITGKLNKPDEINLFGYDIEYLLVFMIKNMINIIQ